MAKIFGGTRKAVKFNDIENTKAMIKLFAGMTLDEVGFKYKLDSTDVKWSKGENPKTNQTIWALKLFNVGADKKTYVIPVSRGLDHDKCADPEYLLACEFRGSFLSVKNDDGTPKEDENGNVVLDENRPYLSFGKPGGFGNSEELDAFVVTEDDIAALKAGNKSGAAA